MSSNDNRRVETAILITHIVTKILIPECNNLKKTQSLEPDQDIKLSCSNEKELQTYVSNEKDARNLIISGSFDFATETATIKFHCYEQTIKTISWKLFYQDKQLSDSIICEIGKINQFSRSKLLKLAISKVDRHVFYKMFMLAYSYEFANDINTYNGKYEIEVSNLIIINFLSWK